MRAAAIAVALSAATACAVACTDPAVRVQFDVPDDYRDQVESVEMELLLPPPGAPFDCDAVAFREVSDGDLVAATVEQVSTREGSAELSAIPRLGDKLFLARGVDGAGDAVVAACGQLGDIDSDVDLSLTGEPTAGVVLPSTEPGSPLVDFTAGVFDIASRPLAGVATRWTVTGPGDETSTGMATTDDMGRVMIAPQAPALPGPIAVDVRPRWVRTTPPSLLAFRQPDPMLSTALPGDATDSIVEADLVVGRFGPNGEIGFAALGPGASPITVGRQVLVGYYDPTRTPPLRTTTTTAIPGAFALGVVSTGARDELFTINGGQWITIAPNGTLAPTASPRPGHPATRIVPVGGCGSDGSDEVMVVWNDDSANTYGPGGAPASSPLDDPPMTGDTFGPADVLATGCVAGTDGKHYRAAVFGATGSRPVLKVEMDTVRRADLATVTGSVGFTEAIGEAGPYLLVAEITIEGTELDRYRVLPLGQRNVELDLAAADPTPALPTSSGGADLDGDGELDVAALLTFGDGPRAQFRVFTALEVDHQGDRLRGLSPPGEALRPVMKLADLDGDGVSELIIASATQLIVLQTVTP